MGSSRSESLSLSESLESSWALEEAAALVLLEVEAERVSFVTVSSAGREAVEAEAGEAAADAVAVAVALLVVAEVLISPSLASLLWLFL